MPSYPSRTVLDEQKRWKIITMIANGSSRRTAAYYVGCSPATITRTADRDPEFAAQIALEGEILKGPIHRISKRRLPPPLPKQPAQHPSSDRHEVANPSLDLNHKPVSTSIVHLSPKKSTHRKHVAQGQQTVILSEAKDLRRFANHRGFFAPLRMTGKPAQPPANRIK
jgi:hypothetical protein